MPYGLFRTLYFHNPAQYSHIAKLALHFYVYAPLRSVQNEHPLDVLHLMFGGSQVQKPYHASMNVFLPLASYDVEVKRSFAPN